MGRLGVCVFRKNRAITEIMSAAIKGLFSKNQDERSVSSGRTSHRARMKALPERVDSIAVEWTEGHVYVTHQTMLDDTDYHHGSTSLTKVHTREVPRALYIMIQIKRLRQMMEKLEVELEAHGESFIRTGSIMTDVVPQDLVEFILTDEGIRTARGNKGKCPRVTAAEIIIAASGLLGVTVACPQ